MEKLEIKIKRTRDDAKLPTKGSEYAAGYDLYACLDGINKVIPPHYTEMIDTGISMEIPEGYVGLVFPRSGLAAKENLSLENCVGVIDADFRDSIKALIHNDGGHFPRTIDPGERIAQIIIMPYPAIEFIEVNELSGTVRGTSGFGSTGKF